MKTLTLAVISSGSRKAAAYHSVSNTVSSVNSVSSWVTRATDCLETRTVEAAELSGALSPPIRFDRLSTPSSSTDPEHVAILPASAERRVVFPPPEGPMMATRSPGEAWPLIPWRMRLGAPPTGTSTLKSENTRSMLPISRVLVGELGGRGLSPVAESAVAGIPPCQVRVGVLVVDSGCIGSALFTHTHKGSE
jgi:hypothetical protein